MIGILYFLTFPLYDIRYYIFCNGPIKVCCLNLLFLTKIVFNKNQNLIFSNIFVWEDSKFVSCVEKNDFILAIYWKTNSTIIVPPSWFKLPKLHANIVCISWLDCSVCPTYPPFHISMGTCYPYPALISVNNALFSVQVLLNFIAYVFFLSIVILGWCVRLESYI